MKDPVARIVPSLVHEIWRVMAMVTMRSWFSMLLGFAGVMALGGPSAIADIVTLYDGSGRPSLQPWLFYAASPFGSTTETVLGAGVRLQTDGTAQAGYSNYIPALPTGTPTLKNSSFPVLNRGQGFELSFQLAIDSESHANNNRAGVSVLLLGADARGIELGFWTDRVWAQNDSPLFTQGEGVAVDTTQQRSYALRIVGDSYQLSDAGGTLLSGSVRDYSTFGTPYQLANYFFVGDNTTSAAANMRLGAIALNSNLSTVPEPASWTLVLAASMLAARIRGRRVVDR